MKKFGFCVSLVTEDLKDLVPSHSVGREAWSCGQVYGRSSPGRAGDRRWVGTHSWRVDRTVNGQDVNSTSGIHSWNLGQSTSLRDLRRTINRFVTVEYPTHRSPTLSIVHGDGFCALCPVLSLNSDFHFLVYLRPPISCRTASSSTFLKDGYSIHSSVLRKVGTHLFQQ